MCPQNSQWNEETGAYELTSGIIRDSLNLPLLWNTALSISATNENGASITGSVLSFKDIWTGGNEMIKDIRPSNMAGYQIATDNDGRIRFMIKKPASGSKVIVSVNSIYGFASGTIELDFTDK